MSKPLPFSPLHEPAKHVSHERMKEILASHTPKAEEPCKPNEVGETPKAELQWDKPMRTGPLSGYVLTLCGLYSVTLESVDGVRMYRAWKRPSTDLGTATTAAEAQAICQAAS